MGDCSPMQLHSGTRDIGVRFDSKTNGTGAIRQFVSKATRLSSRVAFCYLRLVPGHLNRHIVGHLALEDSAGIGTSSSAASATRKFWWT